MKLQNESQGFEDKQFCLQEEGLSGFYGFCDFPVGKFREIDKTSLCSLKMLIDHTVIRYADYNYAVRLL
jgi:hypothetical protein